MPMTITLKNIPDMVYAMLKTTAARDRRSLNSQAIHYLEASLMAQPTDAAQQQAQIDALRQRLLKNHGPFDAAFIDAGKREGLA